MSLQFHLQPFYEPVHSRNYCECSVWKTLSGASFVHSLQPRVLPSDHACPMDFPKSFPNRTRAHYCAKPGKIIWVLRRYGPFQRKSDIYRRQPVLTKSPVVNTRTKIKDDVDQLHCARLGIACTSDAHA